MTVNFNQVIVKALIDTSSQSSALTKEIFNKLLRNKIPFEEIPVRVFTSKSVF